MEFLFDLVPTWAWLLIALGTLYAIHRFFGWKATFAAAAGFAALLLFKKGRATGQADVREDIKHEDLERAETVREVAADARADADRRNADPVELRVDDGFQRD